jgi:hypothetical protein
MFGWVGLKMVTRHIEVRYFFVVVVLVLMTIAVPRYLQERQKQKHEAIAALTSIRENYTQLQRESVDSNGNPVPIAPRPLPKQKASGDFGEFERLMLELTEQLVAQHNDYLAEWEAIGWASILDARRLDQDRTLAESRKIVQQAYAIVDKYEARTVNLIRDLRARIHTLRLSQKARNEMVAGFDKSLKKGRLAEHWGLEKSSVREVSDIIELLATSQHGIGWIVEGDQIQCMSDEVFAAYNSHIEEIHRITQRQDQVHKDAVSRFDKKLEEEKRSLTE